MPGLSPTFVTIQEPEYKSKADAAWAKRLGEEKRRGDIQWYAYEPIGLRLSLNGKKCVYWVDFIIIDNGGRVVAQEIKGGYIRPKGLVKYQAAEALYPWLRFEMWQVSRKGTWRKIRGA